MLLAQNHVCTSGCFWNVSSLRAEAVCISYPGCAPLPLTVAEREDEKGVGVGPQEVEGVWPVAFNSVMKEQNMPSSAGRNSV